MMEAKFTPGPWAWFGNQHGIYLATTHSGRQYIMAFDRWGMQNAQPSFRRGGIMVPASEIVEFAVGDGKARGFKEGKADESVYRYDIAGIDSPDARLIAAAPDLLTALEDFDNWFCGFNPEDQASRMEGRKVVIRARAAIARATASPPATPEANATTSAEGDGAGEGRVHG